MKITNKRNLPQTIVNVLHRPTYNKGTAHISATELINSPRIVQLKRMHWNELEQDAAEMVWSLFGSAVHNILEHGKDEHHIVEQRLTSHLDGWTISGAIDLQEVEEDGIIINDYKVTSSWTVMTEKQDWVNQLNIYAWLVEAVKKQVVKKLQIIAIIRDWKERETKNPDYPQAPIVTIEIPLWPMEDRIAFIKARLDEHSEALLDASLESPMRPCTSDQMWERPTLYAVMKEGGKRAKKVYEVREDADRDLAAQPAGHFIEVRPGSRVRCEGYCPVSGFCDQYQQWRAENAHDSIDQ